MASTVSELVTWHATFPEQGQDQNSLSLCFVHIVLAWRLFPDGMGRIVAPQILQTRIETHLFAGRSWLRSSNPKRPRKACTLAQDASDTLTLLLIIVHFSLHMLYVFECPFMCDKGGAILARFEPQTCGNLEH